MKRVWIYQSNTFEVNTRGSQINALALFKYTFAKLSVASVTNPVIQVILISFEPFYKDYCDKYALKQVELEVYKKHTLQFKTILDEIVDHIRIWESNVRAVHVEDSEDERKIFPKKRTPFFSQSYKNRIKAIKSLSIVLSNYPILSATKTLVDTYYNRLEGSRLAQQQKEVESDRLSALLESQRIITCTELYGVLAQLMYHFRYNTKRVNTFFDISLLR